MNEKLNHEFLEKCMPYAPDYPAIYFNAACLYVEMKDFDQAITCIKLAKKHRYNNYDGMMRAMKRDAMFKTLRKDPRFKALR